MANLSAFEVSLQKATPDDFDRVFKGMLASGVAMGRMDKQDDKARQYLAALYRTYLEDLPLDLLTKGVRLAVAAWRFPGLPEPEAIRSHVVAEIIRRKSEADKVRRAIARFQAPETEPFKPWPERTDEERKAFTDMMAKVRAAAPTNAEPPAIPVSGFATMAQTTSLTREKRAQMQEEIAEFKADLKQRQEGTEE